MSDSDTRPHGLRAGDLPAAIKGTFFTTDRGVWLLVVGALLLLTVLRAAFRGALGD